MRILNTKQIRELDAYTIKSEPIASIDLMERASRAFADWLTARVERTKRIGVVCGTGNNGGDGLAIARILHEWGYTVRVWVVRGQSNSTEDFQANLRRLPNRIHPHDVVAAEDEISFANCDVLIDAMFGSGLSRPVEDVYEKVISVVNQTEAVRIAVDVPSGLMAEVHSSGAIVKADYTISFQLPKLAFMLPEANAFTGEWVLVDIGLDKGFIQKVDTPYHYVRSRDVRRMLKVRSKYDHKGKFGHGLLIAGSHGKIGAAVLAASAALRSGIGLLSIHAPGSGYAILQTAVPEAMVLVDPDDDVFTEPQSLEAYTAVGIGPGLGRDSRTRAALEKTLKAIAKPVVLDADALNIISENRHMLGLIPSGSILTPHPKEFERLTGPWKDDFERLELQKHLARELSVIVVLKGAHTSIANENGHVYFNSTGNPGMATGGTGDVLTGLVTGLLAQNYTPVEAAVAGVFIHGLAGDLGAKECGMDGLIASDVVRFIPGAFLKLISG